MEGRGDVVWSDFVHEERLGVDGAYWQWGDVRGEEVDSTLYTESLWPGHGHIRGRGMDSRIRLHGGRLFVGNDGLGGQNGVGLRGRAVRGARFRSSNQVIELVRSQRHKAETAYLLVVYRSICGYGYACRHALLPGTEARGLLKQAPPTAPTGRKGRRWGGVDGYDDEILRLRCATLRVCEDFGC